MSEHRGARRGPEDALLASSGSKRVFFAIWPDAGARLATATLATRLAREARGRPTAPERLHLTLAFIGDARPPELATLIGVGGQAAAQVAPFDLPLDHVGGFRRTGIVWIGPEGAVRQLDQLVAGLRGGIAAAGLGFDTKPFRAHVTLVRRATGVPSGPDLAVNWHVGALTLTASRLAAEGPAYTELAAWPLSAENVRQA